MSPITLEIRGLLERDDVSVDRIPRLALLDPVLAAAVLKLANSAMFSRSASPTTDVKAAIDRFRHGKESCLRPRDCEGISTRGHPAPEGLDQGDPNPQPSRGSARLFPREALRVNHPHRCQRRNACWQVCSTA